MNSSAKKVALGGVFAALAVVIMFLGGMIPFATYVCSMLCALMLEIVRRSCGTRIAWAWYGAVAVLSLLLSPDKESAAVFVFQGFYPIIKPRIDACHVRVVRVVFKVLVFNVAILVMYAVLIHLFGMAALAAEFAEMGTVLLVVTLIMVNVTFFMLDSVLSKLAREK